jgi:3-dehydrosphinganine reductase
LTKLIKQVGKVDVLLTCAGLAIPGRFLEQEIEVFEKQMRVNYFGSLNAIKVVAPFMKEQRSGRIVITSSMAGLVGLMGNVGYCATKFALRGLAEALQMELSPYKIFISLVVPPDTDTPGFKEENKTKPLEAKLIQEGSGIYHPDEVAETLIDGVKNYRYFIANGFDGFALSVSAAAMAPVHSVGRCLLEVSLSSVFRVVCLFIRRSWTNIVKAHKK